MSLDEAQERHKTLGRNDSCSCGSGKKYKKCHQVEDDQAINAELRRLVEVAEAEAAAAAEAEEEKAKADGAAKGKASGKAKSAQGSSPTGKSGKSAGRASTQSTKAQSLPRRGAV
jgi:hypothetical protein